MGRLDNKVALISGGTGGQGSTEVKLFCEEGAKVVFGDVRDKEGKALEEEIRNAGGDATYINLDVTQESDWQSAVSKTVDLYGQVNILINNAANDERHKIEDVTEEYWNNRINVNLRHYFFSVQSVREIMIKNKSGVIVNVGSISWMIGQGGMAIYTAAKSAVVGLTRSFARDLGEFNIRVNSVVPGWTITERQIEKWLTPEAEADMMKKQCLKRRLMPSEIAKAILFFSSDQSSGCTNQSYIVDNGWY